MILDDNDTTQYKFQISELTFTATSNLHLHVIDGARRQEHVFGHNGVMALLEAVKDDYFEVVEPQLEWFRARNNVLFVEPCLSG